MVSTRDNPKDPGQWWVVFAGALAHAVSTGLAYFGLSAYFPSFEREFGWSRTAISGAFSMARIESGLLGPAEGYVTDRLGPKRVMYIGVVICAVGFVGLSFVNSLPMLYVVVVLGIVLGSSIGFYIPISVVVATLFRARRGLAFGIFRMGPGLSGAFVPVVGIMIVSWGWRSAAVVSSVALLVLGLPLAWAIGRAYEKSRDEQEELQQRIETLRPAGDARSSRPPLTREISFTLKEALRTRAFWLLSAAMGLRQLVTEGVSVHFVILLVDRGWGQELASSLLGISALIGAPARLGFGWLGDLASKRHLIMGLLSALGVSVFLMGRLGEGASFMSAMVVYSLCYGGLASLQEPIRADYFGTRHFASIQGFSRLFVTMGSVMGPLSAGYFYDLTKSYTVAFSFFSMAAFASTVLMFWAVRPEKTLSAER